MALGGTGSLLLGSRRVVGLVLVVLALARLLGLARLVGLALVVLGLVNRSGGVGVGGLVAGVLGVLSVSRGNSQGQRGRGSDHCRRNALHYEKLLWKSRGFVAVDRALDRSLGRT